MTAAARALIPYTSRDYLPNGPDVSLRASTGGGRTLGSDEILKGYRQIGRVRVAIDAIPKDLRTANPKAILRFSFIQQPSSRKPLSVSVNPERVKLQEAGRTLTAKLENERGNDFSDGMRGDYASLSFGAPSGVSEDLRFVFEPGAIRIGGRSVAFAPIRYKLYETTSIGVVPCIPA